MEVAVGLQAAFLLISASKSRWLWHLVVEYGRNMVSHPASGWLSTSLHLSDLPSSAHMGGPHRGRTSFGLAALASLRRGCGRGISVLFMLSCTVTTFKKNIRIKKHLPKSTLYTWQGSILAKILGQSSQVRPELSLTQVIKSVVRELLDQREGWLFLGWFHTPHSSMKQLMLPGRQTGSKGTWLWGHPDPRGWGSKDLKEFFYPQHSKHTSFIKPMNLGVCLQMPSKLGQHILQFLIWGQNFSFVTGKLKEGGTKQIHLCYHFSLISQKKLWFLSNLWIFKDKTLLKIHTFGQTWGEFFEGSMVFNLLKLNRYTCI